MREHQQGLFVAMVLLWGTQALAESATESSEHTEKYSAQARASIKAFAAELKGTLQVAIKSGGPAEGIQACNLKAPGIAESHSLSDWDVGRTSLKLRNPNNAPDDWEHSVLISFEQRLAAGENPKSLEASKVEGNTFYYMKAIPTGALCMACHGEALDPAVASRLSELYPDDQATGYQPGQLRGAFSLSRPLSEKVSM
jgi:hypothetical protein